MAKATRKSKRTRFTLVGLFLGLLGLLGAAAASWIVYSRVFIKHQLPLPAALNAKQQAFQSSAGTLNIYQDTAATGTPLLLIHSINAAGSAYEMKPLFEALRQERPVYALELPGFGMSERAERPYSARLYAQVIGEVLQEVVGEAADVVALSLGSEFTARAAPKHPELLRSLTLISPSGLQGRQGAGPEGQETRANEGFYRVASNPLWARAFYDLIATPKSIHYFLQKSFVGKVDEGLEAYAFKTAHQPGAEHAPLRFISGKLFTRRAIDTLYRKLTCPTLILYDKDGYVDFEALPALLRANNNVTAVRLAPSQGLPHFELPGRTLSVMRDFWSAQSAAAENPAKIPES